MDLMALMAQVLGSMGFTATPDPAGLGHAMSAMQLKAAGFPGDNAKIQESIKKDSPAVMQNLGATVMMKSMTDSIMNQAPYAAVPVTAPMAMAIIIPTALNLINMLEGLGLLNQINGNPNPISVALFALLSPIVVGFTPISETIKALKDVLVGPLQPLQTLLIPPIPTIPTMDEFKTKLHL